MANANVIKSYLIGLGFDVNQQQFRSFKAELGAADLLVSGTTASIAKNLFAWQAGLLGGFIAISGAVLKSVDGVSQADQTYRLMGERMGMSTRQARGMKEALDALGQPIEAIAFDQELFDRYQELIKLRQRLDGGEGPDAEANLKKMRDVRQEFAKLEIELNQLERTFVLTLFSKLGGDQDVLTALRKANEWLIQNLPKLTEELADNAAPVLRDTWEMLKAVAEMLGAAATGFTNLVGVLAGDDSLQAETVGFHEFSKAIQDVVSWMAQFFHLLVDAEKAALHLAAAVGVPLMSAFHTLTGHPDSEKDITAMQERTKRQFGLAGASAMDFGRDIEDWHSAESSPAGAPGGGANGEGRARQTAEMVGAATGIDPKLLFEQYIHETDHLKNEGARNYHNLAGIRMPGSKEYRHFDSDEAFAKYDAWLLMHRYSGLRDAHSEADYARTLKAGRYMEDSSDNYERGMRAAGRGWDGAAPTPALAAPAPGSGDVHVSIENVNVLNPTGDGRQAGRNFVEGVREKAKVDTQRNLVQSGGGYK